MTTIEPAEHQSPEFDGPYVPHVYGEFCECPECADPCTCEWNDASGQRRSDGDCPIHDVPDGAAVGPTCDRCGNDLIGNERRGTTCNACLSRPRRASGVAFTKYDRMMIALIEAQGAIRVLIDVQSFRTVYTCATFEAIEKAYEHGVRDGTVRPIQALDN